jgi:hypothetical protein
VPMISDVARPGFVLPTTYIVTVIIVPVARLARFPAQRETG